VLAHLNVWFGTIAEVVEAHGGNVLKSIGGAVLAIFPNSEEHDRKAACRNPLVAAQEFCQRSEAENVLRRSSGNPPLAHGLALHVTRWSMVMSGAPHRLDSVIRPPVSQASRLLNLTKWLDQQVLVSHAVAREVDQSLIDLGRRQLRDVETPQQVFALPEQGNVRSH
jgi:adenylate cyclase